MENEIKVRDLVSFESARRVGGEIQKEVLTASVEKLWLGLNVAELKLENGSFRFIRLPRLRKVDSDA